jgi:hypothetical protein
MWTSLFTSRIRVPERGSVARGSRTGLSAARAQLRFSSGAASMNAQNTLYFDLGA